jgi:hypothetical protein
MKRHRRQASLLLLPLFTSSLLMLMAAACERPPVTPGDGDGDGDGEGDGDGDGDGDGGRFVGVALEGFQQDRYAMGTKWYAYEPGAHVLTPYPQAFILRDEDSATTRYAAFRVKSYYDENTAESGLFTLALSFWENGAWTDEQEWETPRNVKNTGPMCVDIFSESEKGCDANGWQLSLRNVQYMAVFSGIVVNNAGVFVRSAAATDDYGRVLITHIDDKPSLDGLPDPTTIPLLDDAPPPDFLTTDWAFEEFAPNLPEAGMIIGTRYVDDGFVGRDDVWALVNSRFWAVKFTLRPTVDGDPSAGLEVTFGRAELDVEDMSYDIDTFNTLTTIHLDAPAAGDVRYLSFQNADLSPAPPILDPDAVTNASWPHKPPNERAWDLALETVDGTIRVLLSPGCGAAPVTQYEIFEGTEPAPLETAVPPHYVD